MPKKDLDAAIARAEYAIGAARRAHGEGGEMRLIDVAIDACKSLLDIQTGFGMEFAGHAKYESIISAYEDLQQRKTVLTPGGRLGRSLQNTRTLLRKQERARSGDGRGSSGYRDLRLQAASAEVDALRQQAQDNIGRVLDRGAELDDLVDKTARLQTGGLGFRRAATTLRDGQRRNKSTATKKKKPQKRGGFFCCGCGGADSDEEGLMEGDTRGYGSGGKG